MSAALAGGAAAQGGQRAPQPPGAAAAGLVVHRDDGEIQDTAGAVVVGERLLVTPLEAVAHARRVLVTTPKDSALEVPVTAVHQDTRRNLAFLRTPVAVGPPAGLAGAETPASGEPVALLHAAMARPLPAQVAGVRQDEDGVRWVYVQVSGQPLGADYRGALVVADDGRTMAMVVRPVPGTQDLLAAVANVEIAEAVARLGGPATPPAVATVPTLPAAGVRAAVRAAPAAPAPAAATTAPAPSFDGRTLRDGAIFAPPPPPPVSMDESLFASQLEQSRRLVAHMRNIAWRVHRQPLNQLTRERWEDVYFKALSELGILSSRPSP